MSDETRIVAAAFDQRAANYSRSDWHRQHAERLVELAALEPGQRVLDAGTGTGFAALALARRLGPSGHVTAVDVSQGMLERARAALDAEGSSNVDLVQADATDLPAYGPASFDAVICSAALLYMPVEKALREWHRLLTADGLVGFSTMRTGSPPVGRLFRDCARRFGVTLADPGAGLGSEERSRAALASVGFRQITFVSGQVHFSVADLTIAWESNLRSAGHSAVRDLAFDDQDALRVSYEAALQQAQTDDERSVATADVLYAFGRK
jgi:ubiquinone/menaquinone biosynthesis C-methylase UbiE